MHLYILKNLEYWFINTKNKIIIILFIFVTHIIKTDTEMIGSKYTVYSLIQTIIFILLTMNIEFKYK